MPEATYDHEGDILYVRLQDGEPPARQVFLDDLRILDYSADGGVVGAEFIGASAGIDLRDVPFAQRMEQLIDESGHSFPIFA